MTRLGRAEAQWTAKREGSVIVNGGNCPWPDINWVHWLQYNWKPRLHHAPAHVRLRQWLSQKRAAQAERQACSLARAIVANSERTRSEVIQTFGIQPDQVHTIYLGTDPEVFRPASPSEKLAARKRLGWPAQTLTAVFIGALGYDRRKGFDLLFDAWKQLCADPAWDVDLVAAGGGAEVGHWRSQAQKFGLDRRIRMMGFTHETSQLVRAADVMVHPVFYEPYGLGVQEALCCGVAALVTRSAGIAERYPRALFDLLLEGPPSVDDLVEKLRRWRADCDAWPARVSSFSAQLRRHTWRDMAREFVEWTMPSLMEGDGPRKLLGTASSQPLSSGA